MAYAFDKVSDYFRRQKSGQRGNLDKGGQGAPPPTAAAEGLAKQAETSAQQGASDTSAFRANRGAVQSGAQQALTKPAQQQANTWGEQQQAKVGEYLGGERKKIEETYKPFDAGDIAKVEAGDQATMAKVGGQRQYTGNEMTFQDYKADAPQIDTTSMLSGGVGGMQAALQKSKGGRYTGGMAALDASLLANNQNAMSGLQTQLGDIYQGTRDKAAQFEQADETLRGEATKAATDTAGTVRKALQDRMGNVKTESLAALQKRAQGLSDQSRTSLMPSFDMMGSRDPIVDAMRQSMRAQGMSENDINMQMRFAGDINPNQFITHKGFEQISETPQNYANIAAALGVPVEALTQSYETFGLDQNAINAAAQRAQQGFAQNERQLAAQTEGYTREELLAMGGFEGDE